MQKLFYLMFDDANVSGTKLREALQRELKIEAKTSTVSKRKVA